MEPFALAAVIAARLAGATLILRYPLAGALLSEFVLDAFDGAVLEWLGAASLVEYASLDNLLDVYQHVMQLVVVAGWTLPQARTIGLWLFGIRAAGFLLYEGLGNPVFLFVFPNVFSLYFIAYYVFRRGAHRTWLYHWPQAAAMLLTLCALKLPQEYVLHLREIPAWALVMEWVGLSGDSVGAE